MDHITLSTGAARGSTDNSDMIGTKLVFYGSVLDPKGNTGRGDLTPQSRPGLDSTHRSCHSPAPSLISCPKGRKTERSWLREAEGNSCSMICHGEWFDDRHISTKGASKASISLARGIPRCLCLGSFFFSAVSQPRLSLVSAVSLSWLSRVSLGSVLSHSCCITLVSSLSQPCLSLVSVLALSWLSLVSVLALSYLSLDFVLTLSWLSLVSALSLSCICLICLLCLSCL